MRIGNGPVPTPNDVNPDIGRRHHAFNRQGDNKRKLPWEGEHGEDFDRLNTASRRI